MPRAERIEALILQIGSGRAKEKFAAAKALRLLSARAPAAVYPYFNFFAALLGHANQILKWNATLTLANLAVIDHEGKLDRILKSFLAPISGPSMISAANAIRGAASIAAAKPYLADTIVRRILQVERASYATRECRNVAIGHAILALQRCFAVIEKKRPVVLFVSRQLKNPRPATRAKAELFLQK